jgi:hypothetical protein
MLQRALLMKDMTPGGYPKLFNLARQDIVGFCAIGKSRNRHRYGVRTPCPGVFSLFSVIVEKSL